MKYKKHNRIIILPLEIKKYLILNSLVEGTNKVWFAMPFMVALHCVKNVRAIYHYFTTVKMEIFR